MTEGYFDISLHQEHQILGASFSVYGDYIMPSTYGDCIEERASLQSHTALCDLSNIGKIRLHGSEVEAFIRIIFECDFHRLRGVGAGSEALIVSRDHYVIDHVTLIHSGDDEYMLLTTPEHRERDYTWLCAHRDIGDVNQPVFGDLTVEDRTQDLACMALIGTEGAGILSELAASNNQTASDAFRLPEPDHLNMVTFDRLPVLIYHRNINATTTYQLLTPTAHAVVLWRALMSFPLLMPIGTAAYRDFIGMDRPLIDDEGEVDD